MRQKLYKLVEAPEGNENADFYDILLIFTIIISIIPLMFKTSNTIFDYIDKFSTFLFIIDYLLRWSLADFAYPKYKWRAFFFYPIMPLSIIDALSILPCIISVNQGLRLFKAVRLIRMFRVFRVFKAFRYSKSLDLIIRVFKAQKDSLITVCYIAGGYIFISALVIFNVEPASFNNFFDAIYWATVSLTTVGYGDIYPVTTAVRVITILSSLFGIAIIAMPAGIITAGIMEELNK